jgi:hypothetical protein
MRLGKAVIVGLAGMLAWWTVASAAEPLLGGAWVSAVEGDAQVQFAEEPDWKVASLNTPLLPRDRIQLGPTGRIEVLLSDGTAIRLGPESAARLVSIPPTDAQGNTTAEMDLEAGRVILATREGDRTRPIVTLNATGTRLQVYPRSLIRAEAVAADATDVMLREGAATADTLGTTIPLRPGETFRLGPGATFQVATRSPDDFDRWSDSRDHPPVPAPVGSPYVPAPLAPYAADLNNYGQWTSVPDYGYVWQPTTVDVGWAPFTYGQWMWRWSTWVWIPREPWGWVPFHYGRWRWDPVRHWYWVPPRPRLIAWCPGAVAWIQTTSHVTWLPLAPGEIYYNPWRFGPWSAPAPPASLVNITVVNIRKTFVNAAAPGGLVTVPITTFRANTTVAPPHTPISFGTVAANQRLSVVTPAALMPTRAPRGAGTAAAGDLPPVSPRSVRVTLPSPPTPQPPSGQAAGLSRLTQPPLPVPGRPTPPAAGLAVSRRVPSQPPVAPGQPKGDQQPSATGTPHSAGGPVATVPTSPTKADRPRAREDPRRQDGRGERRDTRPDAREDRRTSSVPPLAFGGGRQVSVQAPVNRPAAPPAASAVQGPDKPRSAARAHPPDASAHQPANPH